MIAEVIANIHLLHFAILVLALHKHIFKEVVVVLLHFLIGHLIQVGTVSSLGRVLRVDVQVLKNNCLAKRGFVVYSGTAVPMPTGTNFKVK